MRKTKRRTLYQHTTNIILPNGVLIKRPSFYKTETYQLLVDNYNPKYLSKIKTTLNSTHQTSISFDFLKRYTN